MKRNTMIAIFFFCYAAFYCMTTQSPVADVIKAQIRSYELAQAAFKKGEPGSAERVVSSLEECRYSLIALDKAVSSKDQKIAELEDSLRKCADKVASHAQGTGFQSGVKWLAGITIVFLILIFLIYLVMTGKLRIPFITGS
ncbi:hypothetical protein ACQV5J_07950 [Leptospira interrogans]|uniref:hypothetical protein n=1 Tax=Leptospira interrogans TaxID=173 RepID=UPI0009CD49C4|nr:hypothetical protein [Leptospira interrogans]OOB99523.1 hypothetical protein B0192_05240 [Leptospira interrogans serovar Australis]